MKLDETQRQKVAAWIDEGLKISEIQTRLEKELGLRMTYLDVRLLVDELKLVPKDPTPPPTPKPAPAPEAEGELPQQEEEVPPTGNVSVEVDQLTRPGALVSGKVTFSDGKSAAWFLDETGRLGISTAEKGYKPTATDVQLFQMELQKQLQKLGM